MTNSEIVITLKAGNAFEDEWVVIHGNTVAEAADILGAATSSGFFTLVSSAAVQFKAEVAANKGLGTTPVDSPIAAAQSYVAPPQQTYAPPPQQQYAPPPQQQQYAPQGQQSYGAPPVTEGPKFGSRLTPPQGFPVPQCPHGTKDLVHGKFGPFWGCPAQQGDPSKCKIEKYHGPPVV